MATRSTTDLLPRLVRVVHQARLDEVAAQDAVTALRMVWEAQHAAELEALAQAKEQRALAEQDLRTEIVTAYGATGSKAPAPGCGVRVTTKLEYDAAEALAWALEHKLALALDARRFEQIAKAEALPFVATSTTVTATIATDLGPVLREEQPT